MSATVDAEKISDFFGGCPTLSVPGRTFPVNTFFLEDAVEFTKWYINGESQYARRCESKGPVVDISEHDQTHLILFHTPHSQSAATRRAGRPSWTGTRT